MSKQPDESLWDSLHTQYGGAVSERPYQSVWDFLYTQYGVTLLESDLLELVRMVRECDESKLDETKKGAEA